jgi:hypothetical protein
MQILESFEQAAAGRFSPMVLLVPGLVMVALGLVAWLGGMCVRRLVLALAGGAVAGLAGLFVGGAHPAVAGLAAGGGAIFGAVAPRLSTALLLAGFGWAATLAVVAKPQPVERPETLLGKPDAGPADRMLTVRESLDVTWTCALDVADQIGGAVRRLTLVDGAIIAAVGLGLLTLGLFLERLAGPLACSLLGTALIAAGLIVLLIYKGSAPIGLVQKQGALYGLVLLGMVAFGTVEQLVLCPPPRRRPKGGVRESGPGQEQSKQWRNR